MGVLFFCLSVFTVEIVPLRERMEDIPLLAEHFLRKEGLTHSLTPAAIDKLIGHVWPGNIRELKNCLQLAVALSPPNIIDAEHIQIMRRRSRPKELEDSDLFSPLSTVEIRKCPAHLEKETLTELIERFAGNRKQIAAAMRISERTLYRKLNEYALM